MRLNLVWAGTIPALLTSVLLTASARGQEYWPAGSEWATISAAEAGFDAKKLQQAVDFGIEQKSLGVVVVRRGKIVAEAYAADYGREGTHEIFSAAKSMTSVLAGMALDEGKFKSLDQSASDFIPAWKGTDKQKITLRHMLTMTSGLKQGGLAVRNVQGDQFALNSAAPLDHPPGTHWEYNTPAYHLMFHLVARAAGERFETYAARKLIKPLGIEKLTWVMNEGKGADGPVNNYYSASCTSRDMARFGLFMLRGGRWNGQQLVSEAYVKQATASSQDLNPSYGFLFWVNTRPGAAAGGRGPAEPRLRFPGSPSDAFAALGAQSQDILIVPSLDLVVVRQGPAPSDAGLEAKLLARVVEAVRP